MAEPIEQAPARVRAAAAAHASGRGRQRAEARDEIAKWKRGEPSRVMTLEELLAGLHALDDADEDAGGTGSHVADPGSLGRKDG